MALDRVLFGLMWEFRKIELRLLATFRALNREKPSTRLARLSPLDLLMFTIIPTVG